MTQYKFRGKRKDNGEWVYGSLLIRGNKSFIIVLIESRIPDYSVENSAGAHGYTWAIEEVRYEVGTETVGMWTGRKDVSGTDIFCGDIVDKGRGEIYWDVQQCQFRVRWHNEVFKKVRGGLGEMLFANSEIVWKVIGNIHDHQHLLTPAERTA